MCAQPLQAPWGPCFPGEYGSLRYLFPFDFFLIAYASGSFCLPLLLILPFFFFQFRDIPEVPILFYPAPHLLSASGSERPLAFPPLCALLLLFLNPCPFSFRFRPNKKTHRLPDPLPRTVLFRCPALNPPFGLGRSDVLFFFPPFHRSAGLHFPLLHPQVFLNPQCSPSPTWELIFRGSHVFPPHSENSIPLGTFMFCFF